MSDWGSDLPSPDDDGSGFGPSSAGFTDDWDVGGVDGNKVGSGAVKVDKPGWYHFWITAEAKPSSYGVDAKTGKTDYTKKRKPSILCTCRVLMGSPGGSPQGALHYHDVVLGGYGGEAMSERDRDSTLNFLVGLGVLVVTDGKVIDPETGTTKIKTSTLCDRINKVAQFVGKLSLNPANPKKDREGKEVVDPQTGAVVMYPERIEFSFGRGVFQVTAKEVAHVPCNEEYLKVAGITRQPPKPNC